MQSRPMRAVRQDDVARLRHARCGRHVSRARAATLRVRDQPGPTGAVVPAGPAADLAVTAPPRSEASVGPAGPVVPASTLFDGVDALPIRPPSLWAQWRAGWARRHTVVTGLLTPAVFAGYVAAMGTGPDGWLATVVVLLAAALAATTIATYLPAADRPGPGLHSSCAAGAGVFVLLALVPLSTPGPGLGKAVAAVGATALGLAQRVLGVAACRV